MAQQKTQNGAIGVFDSGFGGLHVLRGIVRKLPEYDYVYLGDTAHAPYGARTQEEIYGYARAAVDFLFALECELIVFACNTASSDALRKIQQEYLPQHYPDKKVIGVLIPFAEAAVERTKNKRVGVIATEATVASGAYVRELTKLDLDIEVFQKACPLLVPLVEAGEQATPAATLLLQTYLAPLVAEHIDTLILGCTHYGILETQIRAMVGPGVDIVSESTVIPEKLAVYLEHHPEMEQKLNKGQKRSFFTTDIGTRFNDLGSTIFGAELHAQATKLV